MMLVKYKKHILVGLGIVAAFGFGTVTGATTDWKTNAINSAYSELLSSASGKTTELTSNVETDVNTKIQNAIQGSVNQKQAELEQLLEQYYQLKIDGLTDTDEFRSLETTITEIQKNVLKSYKLQIDEAFATTGN